MCALSDRVRSPSLTHTHTPAILAGLAAIAIELLQAGYDDDGKKGLIGVSVCVQCIPFASMCLFTVSIPTSIHAIAYCLFSLTLTLTLAHSLLFFSVFYVFPFLQCL